MLVLITLDNVELRNKIFAIEYNNFALYAVLESNRWINLRFFADYTANDIFLWRTNVFIAGDKAAREPCVKLLHGKTVSVYRDETNIFETKFAHRSRFRLRENW